MRKILLACLFLSFITTSELKAQSCFNVSAGNDTTISCLQYCLDLHAKIPDLRTSEDYQVVSIPYAPYAYVTPFGTTDPLVNADDHFSDSFALPFPFCFYGNTYSKIAVGSNGVITFDVKTNAKTIEGYQIHPGDNIPQMVGVSNFQDTYYPPQASIFLAYEDWNPATSPAGNKIEWRVEGVAPCRRFVVSFYHIANFQGSTCPELTTMQAVLYEGSGIIDVFYENKPACPGYQGGLSIAGVQNYARDRAVTPVGWNGTVWSAVDKGIRYVPSGAGSLLDSVVLYKNNVKVATGVATSLGNGEMDVSFNPPVCQSEDSMSYVVKAFYKQCDNGVLETEGSDTIIVYKTLNPLTANTTATSCPTSADGQITVTVPVGANIEYSINNGASWQSSPVFNTIAGNYTVIARVVGSTCTGSTTVTVAAGTTVLTATITPTATSCPALSDGKITVTPGTGTAPFQYSLDGGAPQASNVFTNVAAGTHNISITDANGCVGSFSVDVAQGPPLTSTITGTYSPCASDNLSGLIVIVPTSGVFPYQFRINGGPWQVNNVFGFLNLGTYIVDFIDVNGCTGSNTVTLTTNPAISGSASVVRPSCNGGANGSITMNIFGGVPPYQYSKNLPVSYQASNVFNGLIAGTYLIRTKDAVGCLYDFPVTMTEPPALGISSSSTIATCSGNDGSILVSETGGTPTYTYSIDGGANYFPTSIFNNLEGGTYNIKVKDSKGCTASGTQTVALNDTMRLDLGLDSTICFGSSITLLPQTNASTDTFRWTPSAGLDYDTAKNPIATPNDTTKYYLHAKWGVCFRDDSITINVLHKPISLAGKDTTICYKSFAILNGSVTNTSGPVTYAWTPSSTVVPPTLPIAVATPDSTQQYVLTVQDSYGCNFTVTDSMWVIMEAPVPAFAGNDTNALLDKPHHMKATGGVSYLWSPAGPLNDPTLQKPTAILHTDTYFRVWVTDAIGCKAFDDVFIKVYAGPEYYLPNAFTPNGDGLNDIFRPTPVGMKSTDYFMVYDRYGELLFQTREWMKGWDGRIKGKDAPMGTYVWIIRGHDENNQLMEKKGTVTLIR